MSTQPQPRVFHTDLEGNYSEVEITLGDPPTFAFVCSPFNFTRPLSHDELRDLAAGRFGSDLDAQLRACTLPPSQPLSDDDRELIVLLASQAWSAASLGRHTGTDAGVAPAPLPPGGEPDEERNPGEPALGAVMIAGATIESPGDVPVPPAIQAGRRALKILLTLRPDGPDRYRALVGVGAEGCDPHFGTTGEPLPLAAALDAVPAIVAAAEARWLTAQRYPTATKPNGGAATPKPETSPKTSASKAARSDGKAAGAVPAAPPALPEPSPASAKPATKNQISLFG